MADLLGIDPHLVEVKRDAMFLHTGNVYIEVSQSPPWIDYYKPSGINVTTADYWAFVCGEAVTLVPTNVIRKCVASQDREPRDGGLNGDNPTKGYTLSLRALLHLAAAAGKDDR